MHAHKHICIYTYNLAFSSKNTSFLYVLFQNDIEYNNMTYPCGFNVVTHCCSSDKLLNKHLKMAQAN